MLEGERKDKENNSVVDRSKTKIKERRNNRK